MYQMPALCPEHERLKPQQNIKATGFRRCCGSQSRAPGHCRNTPVRGCASYRKRIASERKRDFLGTDMFDGMKNNKMFVGFCLLVAGAIPGVVKADGAPLLPMAAESSAASSSADTRYGLFNWLDHRSFYNEGDYPEPFLVDDSGLEVNEARLDWLHTEASGSKIDANTVEVEKGFGLLTLELEVHYERDTSGDGLVQGFDNVDLGARYPIHQYVSRTGFFDNTIGLGIEAGIPTESAVGKNPELVPKVFDDVRIGEHFTMQSVLGYSRLFGPGDDGGLQTFEYGMVFGYTIQHEQLPIPYVRQFIPMFELAGETELNKDDPGHNSLIGNACFRLNMHNIGRVQPRLGLGFVFPVDGGARADVRRGVFTSLVFEY